MHTPTRTAEASAANEWAKQQYHVILADFMRRVGFLSPQATPSVPSDDPQSLSLSLRTPSSESHASAGCSRLSIPPPPGAKELSDHLRRDINSNHHQPIPTAIFALSLYLMPSVDTQASDAEALMRLKEAAVRLSSSDGTHNHTSDRPSSPTAPNQPSEAARASLRPPQMHIPLNPDPHRGAVYYMLGDWYRRGVGAGANLAQAFCWLTKAAMEGCIEAYVALAGMYERGEGIARDDRAAHSLYVKAAQAGSKQAQFKAAFGYERGIGCAVDFREAKFWYGRAATLRHFASAVRLAILSLDPGYETLDILIDAALQSKTAKSMHDVAVVFSTSRHGVLQDVHSMREWLLEAARAGHARSQWMMGKIYQDGLGGGRIDHSRAFFWYHKAALQGYQPAQWAVSGMYRSGNGVPLGEPNPALADKWHRAANRFSSGRAKPDIFDFAGLLSYSLDAERGPKWNASEQDRPFNAMIPSIPIPPSTLSFGSGFTKNTTTSSMSGINVSSTPTMNSSASTCSSSKTGTPPKIPTPNTSSSTQPVPHHHHPSPYKKSVFEIDVDPDSYRDMPSLLHSLGIHDVNPIQEKSTYVPSVDMLYRYAETHPSSVLKLVNIKKNFLMAEEKVLRGDCLGCVAALANGFRTWGGLLDTSIYSIRLLFTLATQMVSSLDSNNADALLSDMFLNMNTRPVEVSWVLADRCIALSPKDPTPYIFRGDVKCRCGQYREAVGDYDTAEQMQIAMGEEPSEVLYHRGLCHSNMDEKESKQLAITDLTDYVAAVGIDGRRTADAQYTLSALYFLMDNPKKMVKHFRYALEAEAVRLEFMPPIINTDLKARLTLEKEKSHNPYRSNA
ncbi:hypothetical protein SeMB42_g01202 [Synchytrium endobioticum]|uniref:Uncharacterized protein n=1 Tax=Synchytrium endobioticum TaxID=286115 RepID=A0A507DNA6_9FUNG|nr:hypothetical protein SeLEV6574_g05758 [Synchytrium endobioticum]TPX52725.1 hypothetical protein SeMB42_g01202 [Synchytrium endobioticum]